VQATDEIATPPIERPRWKWQGVAAAVGVLALAGLLMAGLKLLNRPRNAKTGNSVFSPLRITRFRVVHRRVVEKDGKKTTENHGEIGKDSFEPRFDDAVQVEVALSTAGYLYLLALNPNGKEQLLWPENARQAPARVPHLIWPPRQPSGKERGFYLDDEPRGGLQALALVVAREPLPAYEEWRGRRKPEVWEKLPGGEGVWLVDAAGVREVKAGVDDARVAVKTPGITGALVVPPAPGVDGMIGTPKGLPGTGETELEKRLWQVWQDLVQGGTETVEVLAFPVRAKEGK
jgi:hypothetical protein